MKLGSRIFLAYLLISITCFILPVGQFVKDLKMFFRESVEDPLVDQATLLANLVGTRMEADRFDPGELHLAFDKTYSRPLAANIYGLAKNRVDVRVYITDSTGRIIFDSRSRANIGADYSQMRDVYRTLKGQYGARSTRDDANDPATSVLYVAAPIVVNGTTAGVLTVGKPTTNINAFIQQEKPRVLKLWYLAAGLAILLSFLVSLWLTRPIKRLTRYATEVRNGKRPPLPRMGRSELRDMALALEDMREALEGKKYVEEYVHTFTHEIKSPLSAIRGAAELLDEQMPADKRSRFLSNIRTEAGRIQDIVERMLKLSQLEAQKTLQKVERVQLDALVAEVLDSKAPMLSGKGLQVRCQIGPDAVVHGDPFLLHQALSNIIQNSIDFSADGGAIGITAKVDEESLVVTVEDAGPGIPDCCRDRVFDRFFSLQRPDTGRKSTGLGLNFVREVAVLHGGHVRLENLPVKGLRAVISFPTQFTG